MPNPFHHLTAEGGDVTCACRESWDKEKRVALLILSAALVQGQLRPPGAPKGQAGAAQR